MTRPKPPPPPPMPLFDHPRPKGLECGDKSKTDTGWNLICRREHGHEGEHQERFMGELHSWGDHDVE